MSIEKIPPRRRGRQPAEPGQKRVNVISVSLNNAEAALIRAKASTLNIKPSEYFRLAATGAVPCSVPAINREAWAELARAAANLNQISLAMNLLGDALTLDECVGLSEHLARFRTSLIRADARVVDVVAE